MDDPGGSTYRILFIILLLAMSALFSGAETALFSLTPVRLRRMQEKGLRKAKLIETLLNQGQRVLSALLIGNTMVNIVLTSLVTTGLLAALGSRLGEKWASLIATAVATLLLLAFGEVTPKAVATAIPERFAAAVARPVQLLCLILRPLVVLTEAVTGGNQADRHEQASTVTEEIIKTAVTISEEEGQLRQEDRDMIYGIFASNDTPVSRVMVPRQQIVALDSEAGVADAMLLLQSEGCSRLPIYRRDLDHVIGLVYAKDLLTHLYQQRQTGLADLIRPIMRCRPSRPANQLLSEMQTKRTQFCLVTDESGRTVGLVTLEDLLEEIVGEIADEFDDEDTDELTGVASC